jgi:hypothetical protein
LTKEAYFTTPWTQWGEDPCRFQWGAGSSGNASWNED